MREDGFPDLRMESEITDAFDFVDSMIDAYLDLNERKKTGEVHSMVYDDLIEFANFRVETVTSAALLAQNGKVADALGLCRSVLEHMLLLRLQCKGNRYFEIQTVKKPTEDLAKARATLVDWHAKGEGLNCVSVERYPAPGPPRIMWIYKGLASVEEPERFLSMHYFQFKSFRPDLLRLEESDYLNYWPREWEAPESLVASKKRHKEEAEFRYRYYLSWPALLINLSVNELASDEEIRRIEAHYTFLGSYLHPTPRVARDLHETANFYNGRAAIGLSHDYTRRAVLLTALYVVWLLRSVLLEIADLLDGAPGKYISDPGTRELRPLLDAVPARFPYFWFIDNEAPLWDKFNHAVNYATDEELEAVGGHYSGLSPDAIRFEKDIYSHLGSALTSWSNIRVGEYRSPLDG